MCAALCVLVPQAAAAGSPSGPALGIAKSKLAAALTCSPGFASARARRCPDSGVLERRVSYGWNYFRRLEAAGSRSARSRCPMRATATFSGRPSSWSSRSAACQGHRPQGHAPRPPARRPRRAVGADLLARRGALCLGSRNARDAAFGNPSSSRALCGRAATAPPRSARSRGLALPRGAARRPAAEGRGDHVDLLQGRRLITPQPAASRRPACTTSSSSGKCPGRVVDHFATLADNVAYRLFLDARSHRGPAPCRAAGGACSRPYMPAADPANLSLTGISSRASSPATPRRRTASRRSPVRAPSLARCRCPSPCVPATASRHWPPAEPSRGPRLRRISRGQGADRAQAHGPAGQARGRLPLPAACQEREEDPDDAHDGTGASGEQAYAIGQDALDASASPLFVDFPAHNGRHPGVGAVPGLGPAAGVRARPAARSRCSGSARAGCCRARAGLLARPAPQGV